MENGSRITATAAGAADQMRGLTSGPPLAFFSRLPSVPPLPVLGHIVYRTAEAWLKLPEVAVLEITSPHFMKGDNRAREQWLEENLGYVPVAWCLVEKAITIRQPWAWAILHAGKDCENRSRRMAAPGWYYLHAGAQCSPEYFLNAWGYMVEKVPDAPRIPNRDTLPLGALVGIFQITGWTPDSRSPWFMGPKAAEIGKAFALPKPIPWKGSQGVFYVRGMSLAR